MEENKFNNFFKKFGGMIIGILVGVVVLSFSVLKEFFNFVIIIVACGWFGNFVQKNRMKVKEYLQKLVDKM